MKCAVYYLLVYHNACSAIMFEVLVEYYTNTCTVPWFVIGNESTSYL